MFGKPKKTKICLTAFEYQFILETLIEFRNKLIAQGRYTDAVDDVILKIC